MHSDPIAKQYEEALTLAEAGQYDQALAQIQEYLRLSPKDCQALNDAATILYCMRRGDEAIAYFEKALMFAEGDERTQVYWNLCETYIQEGHPDRAAGLFKQMRAEGVLNLDTLNRTAEAYLQHENLGGAMQMLHESLKMAPDQEVLVPMMEVIRSRRTPVTIMSESNDLTAQMLHASLNQLAPTELQTDPQVMENHQGITVHVGITPALTQASQANQSGPAIVVMNEEDYYSGQLEKVNVAVDAVVAVASDEAMEDLRQQTGLASAVQASAAIEADALVLHEKKQGKRLAAMGPWTTRQNPMFLIQCFQKLHYIDPDTRLYLAGAFKDEGLKRYLEQVIESMDLENVVFFDGAVKNMSKWLKDKHYIVSTAIDGGSLTGIWTGMAHGLKPVVHQFAGAEEMFDAEYVFNLAEDFCDQIAADDYAPAAYRQMAMTRFAEDGLATVVHSVICQLEKEIPVQQPSTPAINQAPAALPAVTQQPAATVNATSISMTQQNNQPPQGQMAQMNFSIPPASPTIESPTIEMTPPSPSIADLAEQALNASKTLGQMSSGQLEPHTESIIDFSTTQPSQPQPETTPEQKPGDDFKYNKQQGLVIDDLMPNRQEANAPFCSGT
ncbi:MAG: tetratricopeptide repeat protein [Planctomycetota bacterium]|jgi:tetratricopeptide (TPR) repeat protein